MSANPKEFDAALDLARRAAAPFARMNALAVRSLERARQQDLARVSVDAQADCTRWIVESAAP